MVHPLQLMIRAIATRSWWFALLWNVARCLTLVLLVGFMVGALDYGLRIQDVGLQWMLAACFWIAFAAGCWRLVLPVMRHRYSEIYVAEQIEHHFPDLGQRLSSSIAFLRLPVEATGVGSADLRQAVIESTSQEIDGMDLGRCVKTKQMWRAVAIACSVLLLVGACFLLDRGATSQAASRLIRPWIHAPWPRWNQLEFVTPPPLKIATGASFQVRVKDVNNHLPEKVVLQYQPLDDPAQMEVVVMELKGEIVQHRFRNVRRSFQFRVLGGDDDTMLWHPVVVVNPPTLEEAHLDVHAPAYMKWPSERVQGSFRALEGSRVTLQGRLDRVAKRVFLMTEEENRTRRRQLVLTDGGQSFSLPKTADSDWTIEQSGRYWFAIEDDHGLVSSSPDQWEVRVVTDLPPVIGVESPPRQHRLLSTGFVTLEINARDDFWLQTLQLQYHRSTAASPVTVDLWRRDELDSQLDRTGFLGSGPLPDQRSLSYRWDLASLRDLSADKWIEYRVLATDAKGQVTESSVGRLNLISRSELDQEIVQQQAHIVARLVEALGLQRDARKHALEIQLQLEDPGTYTKSDLDHMQSVELNQRQVGHILVSPGEGIPVDVARLLSMLEHNRARLPDLSRQLNELLETLEQLHKQQLVKIESQLLFALKTGRAEHETAVQMAAGQPIEDFPVKVGLAIRRAFQQAIQGQHQAIRVLERLLEALSEQEDYRRFTDDIRRIGNLQQQYLAETERLQVDRLGRTAVQLTEAEQGQQLLWGERQIELARQLEGVLARMLEMQDRLGEKDPASAQILSDTIKIAEQQALGGRMRESGQDIQRNQLGHAVRTQSEVHEGLQAMLMRLSHRHEHRLDRLHGQLQDAARQLAELGRKQQAVARRLLAAQSETEAALREKELAELGAIQRLLGKQIDPLTQRLRSLGAERASVAVQAAGEPMRQTTEAIGRSESAQALEGSQLSAKKLADAQRQLERDLFQLKDGLRHQQLERLHKQLLVLRQQQEEIVRDTKSLDALRMVNSGQKLTRVQRGILKALADRQRQLATAGNEAVQLLQQSEAFHFGLRLAAEDMVRAADALDDELTGAETAQKIQLQVIDHLKRLLKALQEKSSGGTTEEVPPENGGNSLSPTGASPRSLAELILLELMQREINRQTEKLYKTRLTNGQWTPQEQEQYTELAKQQGELAAIVDRLKRTADSSAQESRNENQNP